MWNGIGMILDQNSTKSKISIYCRTYPVVKVRSLAEPPRSPACAGSAPSDPLVGGLPRRTRIRGPDQVGLTRDDGSRTSPRTAVVIAVVDPRVVPGFDPSSSVIGVVLPCAGDRPPLGCSPRDGGDEESRTPDLLLAKETLCQLSYVPPLRTGEWKWWAFLDSNQRPLPYQGSALTS